MMPSIYWVGINNKKESAANPFEVRMFNRLCCDFGGWHFGWLQSHFGMHISPTREIADAFAHRRCGTDIDER